MTVETCVLLLVASLGMLMATYFSEQLCSCYYPFLLSAKYYVTIKNPRLRSILISPMLTRSTDSKTAFADRDKLPLCGCIHCIITIPWIFCEIIIILLALVLAVLGSGLIYSSWMTDLMDVYARLYTSKFYLIFIALMPIVHRLDYSIGMNRGSK